MRAFGATSSRRGIAIFLHRVLVLYRWNRGGIGLRGDDACIRAVPCVSPSSSARGSGRFVPSAIAVSRAPGRSTRWRALIGELRGNQHARVNRHAEEKSLGVLL